jgi:hypothetical protein
MSEELADANKKLAYADFLLSKSEASEYAVGAFRHVYLACNIAVRALTNLNQIESESPNLTKQALLKFGSLEAKGFAKFYEELLGMKDRNDFRKSEVEARLRKAKEFISWVQDRLIR